MYLVWINLLKMNPSETVLQLEVAVSKKSHVYFNDFQLMLLNIKVFRREYSSYKQYSCLSHTKRSFSMICMHLHWIFGIGQNKQWLNFEWMSNYDITISYLRFSGSVVSELVCAWFNTQISMGMVLKFWVKRLDCSFWCVLYYFNSLLNPGMLSVLYIALINATLVCVQYTCGTVYIYMWPVWPETRGKRVK